MNAANSGVFVAVVGPSGAGKDTLIVGARARLPADRFVFPQRIITRPADVTEASAFLSEEAFSSALQAGHFLFSWQANGLSYALPGSIRGDLAAGYHVIANVSRGMLGAIRAQLPNVLVVHITAPAEVLAARIAGRNREDVAMRNARLSRAFAMDGALGADVTIDNSGPPADGIAALVATLASLDTKPEPEA